MANKFLKSREIGDVAENELKEYLLDIGCLYVKKNNTNNLYSHDLEADIGKEKKIWFEVKNDVFSEKSGNIALEYWNSKLDRASGFHASKSDFWVHRFNNKLHFCKLIDLVNYTKKNAPKKSNVFGGDDNSYMMLYGIDKIGVIFKEISELSINYLLDYVNGDV